MEDVIFSGTKQRRPAGFAAVTIQLDNHTGMFGEGYGEIVAITRKLYRSGESVYQINGKAVRLKDVQELLMDTGMGRDGYAIIGQGRIAEIVSVRSTDRRELFEEATGVSKFRHKREEAERNLQAAQENLVRLQDIAATLEGRVEPLRRQAETAKQFLRLAEQQKKLEVSIWVQQLHHLEQEKTALKDTLLQARAAYQNAVLDLEQAGAALQQQYQQMQHTTVKIQNLREQVQTAEETAAKTQADLAVCANEQQHNIQRLTQITQQQADADQAEQETAAQLQAQKTTLEALQQQQTAAAAACQEQETLRAALHAKMAAVTAALKTAEQTLPRWIWQAKYLVCKNRVSCCPDRDATGTDGFTDCPIGSIAAAATGCGRVCQADGNGCRKRQQQRKQRCVWRWRQHKHSKRQHSRFWNRPRPNRRSGICSCKRYSSGINCCWRWNATWRAMPVV